MYTYASETAMLAATVQLLFLQQRGGEAFRDGETCIFGSENREVADMPRRALWSNSTRWGFSMLARITNAN